ncbi:S-adenosyl-L-methionine-dependent methyltransferase [Lineolata rhizophorae]|uniref:S-adenosyl-L-methionine-dependent methyltransferase n=1 Tax=Lineolata rhizophorae TaxID=578093 RepID=A0A6A6NTD8_9PEZI|nr:S-adenosyl-L-methionine-dependent methyltransferase [Lineolata rhizophorae]
MADSPPLASSGRRQQLSKGMEHIRYAVTATPTARPSSSSPPLTAPQPTSTPPAAPGDSPAPATAYGVPNAAPPRLPPHRSHSPSNNQKRGDPFQFGSRYLEEGDDVFEFNAWDHVETDGAYRDFAEAQYQRQRENPASEFDRARINADPAKWWNLFYKQNASNFFKNRKWLRQEFPVLAALTAADAPAATVLEVGAGAGNSAFPIMTNNRNPRLVMHACDFSKTAVDVIRRDPRYNGEGAAQQASAAQNAEGKETGSSEAETKDGGKLPETLEPVVGTLHAWVWDLASRELPPSLRPASIDVALMVFVFSALSPEQWVRAVRNIYSLLKPGGKVLFRDYGRGDLAQVRFKKGRWLAENFYVRGDGTRVYFFEKEELRRVWCGVEEDEKAQHEVGEAHEGPPSSDPNGVRKGLGDEKETVSRPSEETDDAPKFGLINIGVDRRLLVNRQRKLKMYRCWIQAVFEKPLDEGQELSESLKALDFDKTS